MAVLYADFQYSLFSIRNGAAGLVHDGHLRLSNRQEIFPATHIQFINDCTLLAISFSGTLKVFKMDTLSLKKTDPPSVFVEMDSSVLPSDLGLSVILSRYRRNHVGEQSVDAALVRSVDDSSIQLIRIQSLGLVESIDVKIKTGKLTEAVQLISRLKDNQSLYKTLWRSVVKLPRDSLTSDVNLVHVLDKVEDANFVVEECIDFCALELDRVVHMAELGLKRCSLSGTKGNQLHALHRLSNMILRKKIQKVKIVESLVQETSKTFVNKNDSSALFTSNDFFGVRTSLGRPSLNLTSNGKANVRAVFREIWSFVDSNLLNRSSISGDNEGIRLERAIEIPWLSWAAFSASLGLTSHISKVANIFQSPFAKATILIFTITFFPLASDPTELFGLLDALHLEFLSSSEPLSDLKDFDIIAEHKAEVNSSYSCYCTLFGDHRSEVNSSPNKDFFSLDALIDISCRHALRLDHVGQHIYGLEFLRRVENVILSLFASEINENRRYQAMKHMIVCLTNYSLAKTLSDVYCSLSFFEWIYLPASNILYQESTSKVHDYFNGISSFEETMDHLSTIRDNLVLFDEALQHLEECSADEWLLSLGFRGKTDVKSMRCPLSLNAPEPAGISHETSYHEIISKVLVDAVFILGDLKSLQAFSAFIKKCNSCLEENSAFLLSAEVLISTALTVSFRYDDLNDKSVVHIQEMMEAVFELVPSFDHNTLECIQRVLLVIKASTVISRYFPAPPLSILAPALAIRVLGRSKAEEIRLRKYYYTAGLSTYCCSVFSVVDDIRSSEEFTELLLYDGKTQNSRQFESEDDLPLSIFCSIFQSCASNGNCDIGHLLSAILAMLKISASVFSNDQSTKRDVVCMLAWLGAVSDHDSSCKGIRVIEAVLDGFDNNSQQRISTTHESDAHKTLAVISHLQSIGLNKHVLSNVFGLAVIRYWPTKVLFPDQVRALRVGSVLKQISSTASNDWIAQSSQSFANICDWLFSLQNSYSFLELSQAVNAIWLRVGLDDFQHLFNEILSILSDRSSNAVKISDFRCLIPSIKSEDSLKHFNTRMILRLIQSSIYFKRFDTITSMIAYLPRSADGDNDIYYSELEDFMEKTASDPFVNGIGEYSEVYFTLLLFMLQLCEAKSIPRLLEKVRDIAYKQQQDAQSDALFTTADTDVAEFTERPALSASIYFTALEIISSVYFDQTPAKARQALIDKYLPLLALTTAAPGTAGHPANSSSDDPVAQNDFIINKLVGQGFSLAGAKKATWWTRDKGSLEAAMSWAVAHSADPDFDHPLALIDASCLYHPARRGNNNALLRNIASQLRKVLESVDSASLNIVLSRAEPPCRHENFVDTDRNHDKHPTSADNAVLADSDLRNSADADERQCVGEGGGPQSNGAHIPDGKERAPSAESSLEHISPEINEPSGTSQPEPMLPLFPPTASDVEDIDQTPEPRPGTSNNSEVQVFLAKIQHLLVMENSARQGDESMIMTEVAAACDAVESGGDQVDLMELAAKVCRFIATKSADDEFQRFVAVLPCLKCGSIRASICAKITTGLSFEHCPKSGQLFSQVQLSTELENVDLLEWMCCGVRVAAVFDSENPSPANDLLDRLLEAPMRYFLQFTSHHLASPHLTPPHPTVSLSSSLTLTLTGSDPSFSFIPASSCPQDDGSPRALLLGHKGERVQVNSSDQTGHGSVPGERAH